MVEVGRKQRLGLKLTQRIADQYSTDWDRHVSRTIPDCRLGVDFDLALLSAVPMPDLDLRPLRFRIVEYLLWRRATRAFHSRAACLPGIAFGGRVVKLRVQTQTRDQRDPRHATDDETFLLAQSHDPQTSGHSSSAKRQDCSDHQDFGIFPNRLGERGRKFYNQRQRLGRQCLQFEDLSWKKWSSAYAVCRCFFKDQK